MKTVKLTLHRDTLRNLTCGEIDMVHGGTGAVGRALYAASIRFCEAAGKAISASGAIIGGIGFAKNHIGGPFNPAAPHPHSKGY